MFRQALAYLGVAALVLAIANLAWVWVEGVTIGDAVGGCQSGGHCFVGHHGPPFTEVSQGTWEWLRFHESSLFVTHPLGMLGLAYYFFHIMFPKRIAASATPAEAEARTVAVRSSGPMLATMRSGGSFGSFWRSVPLLKTWVHPGGIVVKPVFMAEHSILASEIVEVIERRSWPNRSIEIDHSGADLPSPLFLHGFASKGSSIAAATRQIAPSAGQPASEEPWRL